MAKLYEVWTGRNRFCCSCCCGCISGPSSDCPAHIYVYVIFAAVVIPYSIFMFEPIYKISPAIPILFYLSVAVTFLFLNLTTFTDPGFIPKRPFL